MHLFWVAILAATIQVSQNQTGSIEGTVTTSGATPSPLSGAQITVTNSSPASPPLYLETISDSAGQFKLLEVPPGSYVVHVSREGYGFRLSMVTLSPTRSVPVTVTAGTRLQVPPIALTAGGTIRGHIFDRNGKGLAGAGVEFLRITYDEEGRKVWRPGADPVLTDETGGYERSMLAPGDYYVRTVLDSGLLRIPVYYPETAEDSAAAPILLFEGGEITADIRIGSLVPTETYSVSGRVIRPLSEAGKSAFVELVLLKNNPSSPIEVSIRSLATASLVLVKRADSAVDADGGESFEFRGVPAGRYHLLANANIGGEEYSSRAAIYVGDGGGERTELVLRPSVEVKGRVVVEGELPDVRVLGRDLRPRVGDVKLRLNRKDGLPFGVSGPGDLRIARDGRSFSIADVPEGEYELEATIQSDGQSPGSDHYIADVLANGKSVFDTGFRVGFDPVDSLEVIVGTQAGSIQGKIIGSQSSLPAALILVPELFRRSNASLYRVIYLPRNAEFKMSGIAPGNYKLFAVPYLNETVPFRSPDFIGQHESRAASVTVQKGTKVEGLQAPFLNLGR